MNGSCLTNRVMNNRRKMENTAGFPPGCNEERVQGEELKPGDVGTVIHVHPTNAAVVVEFMSLDGDTAAIATVLPSQARPVTSADITYARTVPEAV